MKAIPLTAVGLFAASTLGYQLADAGKGVHRAVPPAPVNVYKSLDGKRTWSVSTGEGMLPAGAKGGGVATPLGEEYDVFHTLLASSTGEGCFLLFDASLPGAPNDVVTFDGIIEDIRTDVLGTVPTVTEMLTDNGDGSYVMEIMTASPMGTEIFPVSGGLTAPSGAALDTPCWFVGAGDALDWEGFDFVTSASMFFTLDGVPVPPAGGGDPVVVLDPITFFNYPNPWDGSIGISFGGWTGISINDIQLTLEVGKVPIKPPYCPADCSDPTTPNPDGQVNVSDLLRVLAEWTDGPTPGLNCDITGAGGDGVPDGVTDVADLLFVLALENWGPCPTPANDDCANATVAVDGANPYDTNGATTDGPDETTGCAFAAGDGQIHCDVWFTYTATCDGNLSIDNCGSFTHDSRIAVYDGAGGCPTTGGTPIVCSDDAACGTGVGTLQSEVLLENISVGSTYLIRVGGFSELDKSNGVLNIDCFIPPDPINCDAATLLGSLPQTVLADTCTGDPVTAAQPCNGVDPVSGTGDANRGKWYRVVGTGNTINVFTEGLYDAQFIDSQTVVYCNDCDNTCCVAGNSSTTTGQLNYNTSWCSEAGVEYLILVKGDGSTCGIPRLTITDGASCGSPPNCDPPVPPNDDCPNAFPIGNLSSCIDPNTGAQFSNIADTAGSTCQIGGAATTDGPLGDGGFGCPFGSVPGKDVWYCYTASCDGILSVNSCETTSVDPNFDAVIYIYDSCACPDESSIPIGCDDDGCGVGGGPSLAQAVGVIQGQDYLIRIGGWYGAAGPLTASEGDFCLNISCQPINFINCVASPL
ncbi:MAG: GC-type dockerin domain-anchored protein, partial [Planctomycetota bacterium]